MIVDDKPANLHLLARMLEERGFQVRPVPDGQLALDAVKAQPPDLILLDIRMPGMNGYQFCERMKAERSTRDIPIIFVSAADALQDKMDAFRIGGVDYVTKPFQIEEVLARIETHLTLSNLRRQLQRTNERMATELSLAGKVQRSLLPTELPRIDGWQIAVKFEPASQTSGDFYDVRLLPDNRLGILVADVSDKGVSAALFMALSWLVFRTYAEQYLVQPELAFGAVNNRILQNTNTGQYITVFYGVLDPSTGKLLYCNAGHHPPFLLRGEHQSSVQELGATGIPMGFFENTTWDRGVAQLDHGDVLVLYTDGITEARNSHQEFFREQRLLQSVNTCPRSAAQPIADSVFVDVRNFMGDVPQIDDMTLLVLRRE